MKREFVCVNADGTGAGTTADGLVVDGLQGGLSFGDDGRGRQVLLDACLSQEVWVCRRSRARFVELVKVFGRGRAGVGVFVYQPAVLEHRRD
jgi:shikimate 5-dehydrogenase